MAQVLGCKMIEKFNEKWVWFCLVGFWLGISASLGEDMPVEVTSIEGITEYRLENGLQLLLFPDASKPVVTVNMTIFVGSRHEGYGEAGMAHLLEHMLFKGTPLHPQITKSLQERGADYNGTTWLDRTNYYETLSAEGDNLEFAIRMEADRLVNSLIRAEDLASEMTVVRNEFESGEDSPTGVLEQHIMAAAFHWHNYAKSTIGNRSDIERVPVDRLRAFYRKFYRPENVMLVIAGKFDRDEALALTQRYFGILENPKTPLDDTYTVEPSQDGERTTVVRRNGNTQLVASAYHIPAGGHPEFAAVELLDVIMGTEPSGRLYQSMVKTGIASTVYSSSYALHDPGIILFAAEVPLNKSIEDARVALIDAAESFTERPVTKEEVDRARTQLLKQRDLRATDTTALATELSEWAAQGDWRLYFLHRDRLESATPEEVQAAAEKYFIQSNRTIGLFIPTRNPQRATIPELTNLKELLADYQGRDEIDAGEAFVPSPENVEQRLMQGSLQSGLAYAVLPKKTRGKSFTIVMNLRFGDEESLFGKTAACEMLGQLMLRGTRSKDHQQLSDELDRLRANVRISSRPGLLQIGVRALRPNWPELLPILKEILREPALEEEEFQLLKDEQLTGLESQLTEPQALAPLAVMKAFNTYRRGDPRYTNSLEEDIDDLLHLDIGAIRDLYTNLLSGCHGEVAVVGDVDADRIVQELDSLLVGWRSEVPYSRPPQPANLSAKPTMMLIETADKANAVYYASQHYLMKDDHPQYGAMLIANYILGGSALSSRLGDRVRQQEGLSYGIGSGLTSHPIDDRASITIFAISNPTNGTKLAEVIREEIARLFEAGITSEELESAKSGYLQSLQVDRTSDGGLAQQLTQHLFAKRTMKYQSMLEQRIRELTVEDVNAAIRSIIRPNEWVSAIAGDLSGNAGK